MVIDKKDLKKYTSKGYIQVESNEVNLEEEQFRKYIHLDVRYIQYIWDESNGKHDRIDKVFQLKHCTKDDFHDTEYEQNYFKLYEYLEFMCIDDPEDEILLYGTKDGLVNQ